MGIGFSSRCKSPCIVLISTCLLLYLSACGNGAVQPAQHNPVAATTPQHGEQQNGDGSWSEDEFTGTGFPCVFYLKYHLYRNSFPLYALARFRNLAQEAQQYCALTFQPGEFRLRSGF